MTERSNTEIRFQRVRVWWKPHNRVRANNTPEQQPEKCRHSVGKAVFCTLQQTRVTAFAVIQVVPRKYFMLPSCL